MLPSQDGQRGEPEEFERAVEQAPRHHPQQPQRQVLAAPAGGEPARGTYGQPGHRRDGKLSFLMFVARGAFLLTFFRGFGG